MQNVSQMMKRYTSTNAKSSVGDVKCKITPIDDELKGRDERLMFSFPPIVLFFLFSVFSPHRFS